MGLTTSNSPLLRAGMAISIAALVVVGGCAKKKPLPDNSAQLGLNNGAKPGTAQDFTLNVGDRVFFTTDSTSLTAEARATLALMESAQLLARAAQDIHQFDQATSAFVARLSPETRH